MRRRDPMLSSRGTTPAAPPPDRPNQDQMTHHSLRARLGVLIAITLAGVAADQLVKALMRTMLADGPRTLIPGVMDLVLVENSGAAFSLGEGATPLFVLVALAVVAAVAYFIARTPQASLALVVSMSCVAAGGLGNMVDRLAKGTVTDFFCTTFVSFPVFNVADIFVTLGVLVTFVLFMRMPPESVEPGDKSLARDDAGADSREA